MSAPGPVLPRHFLRPSAADDAYRAAALQEMPWLADWVLPPGQTQTGPRDPLMAPYALTTLGLRPQQTAEFTAHDPPWIALRKFVQLRFMSQAASLCENRPLHLALVFNTPQDAHECLRAGESTHAPAPSGLSALSLAALLGREDMLKAMLTHGANAHATDELGNSALHWATMLGDPACAAILTNHGATAQRLNVMGGSPEHYEAAWRVAPPEEFRVEVEHRDGSQQVIDRADVFQQVMGFAYMPTMRPSIDFFMNLIVGMTKPAWRHGLRQQMAQFAPLRMAHLTEAPLYFKDFGPPLNWGICAREPFDVGQPITTYAGELVHTLEALVQNFNGDFNPYALAIAPSEELLDLLCCVSDPRHRGGMGSRINGSHRAGAENLDYTCGLWRGLPTTLFHTNRPIRAGEQLFWYYGDGYWAGHPTPAQAV